MAKAIEIVPQREGIRIDDYHQQISYRDGDGYGGGSYSGWGNGEDGDYKGDGDGESRFEDIHDTYGSGDGWGRGRGYPSIG